MYQQKYKEKEHVEKENLFAKFQHGVFFFEFMYYFMLIIIYDQYDVIEKRESNVERINLWLYCIYC